MNEARFERAAALEITKRCPRAGFIVFVTVLSMAERQHPVLCINLYNVPLCDGRLDKLVWERFPSVPPRG